MKAPPKITTIFLTGFTGFHIANIETDPAATHKDFVNGMTFQFCRNKNSLMAGHSTPELIWIYSAGYLTISHGIENRLALQRFSSGNFARPTGC